MATLASSVNAFVDEEAVQEKDLLGELKTAAVAAEGTEQQLANDTPNGEDSLFLSPLFNALNSPTSGPLDIPVPATFPHLAVQIPADGWITLPPMMPGMEMYVSPGSYLMVSPDGLFGHVGADWTETDADGASIESKLQIDVQGGQISALTYSYDRRVALNVHDVFSVTHDRLRGVDDWSDQIENTLLKFDGAMTTSGTLLQQANAAIQLKPINGFEASAYYRKAMNALPEFGGKVVQTVTVGAGNELILIGQLDNQQGNQVATGAAHFKYSGYYFDVIAAVEISSTGLTAAGVTSRWYLPGILPGVQITGSTGVDFTSDGERVLLLEQDVGVNIQPRSQYFGRLKIHATLQNFGNLDNLFQDQEVWIRAKFGDPE